MGALEGRVAIITGAGQGIGREHALVFAREGASVVVNDPGVDPSGDGSDSSVAQRVVDQIRSEGGEAVANTGDVSKWHTGGELVEQALDAYGGLHVLVNNAGILRHAQLAEMTERDFDDVIGVHLKGHFSTIHHAAAYWRSQAESGTPVHASIVNTASAQGLFGGRNRPNETELEWGIDLAQSNYDAAKAGILGLTLSCAIELLRYGVRTNALCPEAATRLMKLYPDVDDKVMSWSDEEFAELHPRMNSFLAAWLATTDCPANGTVWSPSLGVLWHPWSEGGAYPVFDRWPTVDEIDQLIRGHIGLGRLTALGRPADDFSG